MRNRMLWLCGFGLLAAMQLACATDEEMEQGPVGDAPAEAMVVPAPQPRDGLIQVGDPAPDFQAVDHTGVTRHLGELLKIKNVVLIFYPADFTPGCTKQLCSVRDDWSEFENRNAIVLGVNPAGVERHAEFAMEHKFPFPVVSDVMGYISAGYGAKGKNPENPQRTVYVIHQDGRVALSERGMVSHEKIFAALERP